MRKPEWFQKITWILPTTPTMVQEAIAFAPAAFIRHGALPDPRCLDARGGERHEWVPGSQPHHEALRDALGQTGPHAGFGAQLYIVGGSAMIVGYGRERTTRDVDARIEYAKDEGLAAAEEIAAEEDLDPNWLNENARLFMPPARDDRARTVFNTPGLVVTGASAEHMLAMKIDAARNSDEDDIGVLVDQLGITSADQASRYTGRCCPTRRLSTRGDGNSCRRSWRTG